jgi:peroxiredoxin (alkyl hydroperoxide reductase subunit C)
LSDSEEEAIVMSEAASAAAPSLPRLNEPAPDFAANSTHGPIKLSDFKGKWVVLFSHPADFTPVCTTELSEFARQAPAFEKLNTQLIGLSIDSIYSHLAWTRNIEEKFDVKIPYPLIADLDTKVATAYGMIHPGAASTATVRAVFVIDDKQVVRAMIYYPLTNGRNIDEILRLVEALQTSDKNGVSTPCNWKPGEKVIVPPPLTSDAAEKRLGEDYDVTDWYFSKKDLAK